MSIVMMMYVNMLTLFVKINRMMLYKIEALSALVAP